MSMHLRAYLRTYVRVGEACLGTSEVWDSVAGNECSLGSDGWLRTSAKGQDHLVRHGSGEAIISKERFVPDRFLPCACGYEGA